MTEFVTESFKHAANDYFFLLNKKYPEKETVKLVGDRYRLTGLQRTVLFRGITSYEKSLNRKSKLTKNVKEKKLYLDGYNVLYTIMNYILGKAIFIGNDGILRDAGEGYGKIENEKAFYKAMDLLLDVTRTTRVESVYVYLDDPVSNSDFHMQAFKKKMEQRTIEGEVFSVKSADRELTYKKNGVIATSDSEIIETTPCPVLDLARNVLETKYGITILDLGKLLGPG
jgi:hypothetical protein